MDKNDKRKVMLLGKLIIRLNADKNYSQEERVLIVMAIAHYLADIFASH